MPVFPDSKSIFVHINKCAGTSRGDLFFSKGQRNPTNLYGGVDKNGFNRYGESGALHHLSAKNVKIALGDDVFNQYFKFTFVRDPWRRAVSQYCYTKSRPDIQRWIGVQKGFSFIEYLKAILKCPNHVQFQPQHKFIYNDGKLFVDFVGRLESMNADIKTLCGFLKIPVPKFIPNANSRPPKDYRLFYGAQEESLVLEKYSKDFELLNYSKELKK